MGIGGFLRGILDALCGADGSGGQVWAVSLIVAVASAVPLFLYLFSKRFRSRVGISASDGSQREKVTFLHQAVQSLNDLEEIKVKPQRKRERGHNGNRDRSRGKFDFLRRREKTIRVDEPIRRKSER